MTDRTPANDRKVFAATHRDYRSTWADGTKAVMVFRNNAGSCLIPIKDMTDAEYADKLAHHAHKADMAFRAKVAKLAQVDTRNMPE
jgi:hypothetical protein